MSGIRIARRQLLILGLLCLLSRSALAQAPVSITVLPNTVTAGAGSTGFVALSAPAKSAVTVSLTSNTSGVTVPSQVTVGAGRQSAKFAVSTQASDKTAIVTLTASGGGGSAVGFFMVQAQATTTTPLPAFAGFTFSPTMALSGQPISGTISFTEPLVVSLTFNLTSPSANFAFPSQVTAAAGSKMISFPVTVSAEATTGATQVTATLESGSYKNAWTGPFSTSGNIVFLAGTGLPPNYAAGFWYAAPTSPNSANLFSVPTLKTYPDGRLCFAQVAFVTANGATYIDDGPYVVSGHVGYNGQIYLDSNTEVNFYEAGDVQEQFPAGARGDGRGDQSDPTYLYDASTLSFSSGGLTATLTLIAQGYLWTWDSTSSTLFPVFGSSSTLGTYTYTRAQ